MKEFFAPLLLGHLIGDFLLQNRWMAMNKSGSHFKCLVHCVLYTLTVVACTFPVVHGWLWIVLVFLSHYPIDRWSIADKWLDLIQGRSLREFIINGKKDIPIIYNSQNYCILRGAFTGVVYSAADNTIHLCLMYFGGKLFFGV